jgi:hypothetical protein
VITNGVAVSGGQSISGQNLRKKAAVDNKFGACGEAAASFGKEEGGVGDVVRFACGPHW